MFDVENQMAVSAGRGDAHSEAANAVRAEYLARQLVQAWNAEQAALWCACVRFGPASLADVDADADVDQLIEQQVVQHMDQHEERISGPNLAAASNRLPGMAGVRGGSGRCLAVHAELLEWRLSSGRWLSRLHKHLGIPTPTSSSNGRDGCALVKDTNNTVLG